MPIEWAGNAVMNDIAKVQSWYFNCFDCLEARYDDGLKIWHAQEQDPDDGADRLPWCREDNVAECTREPMKRSQ
jgi:hypothetical protein